MGLNTTIKAQILARVEDLQPVFPWYLINRHEEDGLLKKIQVGIMLQEGELVMTANQQITLPNYVPSSAAATAPDRPSNMKELTRMTEEFGGYDKEREAIEELTREANEAGEYDVDAS